MPDKSTAQIPTLMEINAMFFVRLQMANARFQTRCCVCKKRRFNAQEETLWHAKVPMVNKLQKNCQCCGLPKPNCQTA